MFQRVKEVFIGALDYKMFANVICILLFIALLESTGVLALLVAAFESSPLPVPVIIGFLSFIIGLLTGISQGHVAIMMPILNSIYPTKQNKFIESILKSCFIPFRIRKEIRHDFFVFTVLVLSFLHLFLIN